eukprot:scaffold348615_cov18-Prasinocladus_malaysianus.AAC.1
MHLSFPLSPTYATTVIVVDMMIASFICAVWHSCRKCQAQWKRKSMRVGREVHMRGDIIDSVPAALLALALRVDVGGKNDSAGHGRYPLRGHEAASHAQQKSAVSHQLVDSSRCS